MCLPWKRRLRPPKTDTFIGRQVSMRHFQIFLASAVLTALALAAGCSWIGETAGRARAGVENAINDTRSGYHKGYAEGKS